MANIRKIEGIDCVGDAYLGQNYYVKFEDMDDDYISLTVEADDWKEAVATIKARHPNQEILEIEAV